MGAGGYMPRGPSRVARARMPRHECIHAKVGINLLLNQYVKVGCNRHRTFLGASGHAFWVRVEARPSVRWGGIVCASTHHLRPAHAHRAHGRAPRLARPRVNVDC